MSRLWRCAAAEALAIAVVGCGAPDCVTCPDVSGYWSVDVQPTGASPSCSGYQPGGVWIASIAQDPPRGSKITMVFAGRRFVGAISEKYQMTLGVRTETTYYGGDYRIEQFDSFSATLDGAATRFNGSWAITVNTRDEFGRHSSCTENARVQGTHE